MMNLLFTLLVAYGICFGLMNDKAFPITERLRRWTGGDNGFFDRMFSCSYCTGFHAGWIAWILFWVASDRNSLLGQFSIVGLFVEMLMFALASTVFCYLMDTVSEWLEFRPGEQEKD